MFFKQIYLSHQWDVINCYNRVQVDLRVKETGMFLCDYENFTWLLSGFLWLVAVDYI